MRTPKRDSVLENLVASALIGLFGVLAATGIHLTERAQILRERAALAELAGSAQWVKAASFQGPAFRRLYRLEARGRQRYGALLSVGSAAGSERLALLFSAGGELEAARALGSPRRDSPFAREDFLALFLGGGGEKGFPASKAELERPEAASGATRSLMEFASALGQASAAVKALGKE